MVPAYGRPGDVLHRGTGTVAGNDSRIATRADARCAVGDGSGPAAGHGHSRGIGDDVGPVAGGRDRLLVRRAALDGTGVGGRRRHHEDCSGPGRSHRSVAPRTCGARGAGAVR